MALHRRLIGLLSLPDLLPRVLLNLMQEVLHLQGSQIGNHGPQRGGITLGLLGQIGDHGRLFFFPIASPLALFS